MMGSPLIDPNIIDEPIGDQFERAPEPPSWGLIAVCWIAGLALCAALWSGRLW